MIHITLNTGHQVTLPSGLVTDETKRLLGPLIDSGGGNLPGLGAAYRVEITPPAAPRTAAFTFYRGREPLSVNVLNTTVDESPAAWTEVEKLYLDLSDRFPGLMGATAFPTTPSCPWLATVILPAFALVAQKDAGFIGHMESCIGLLLLERMNTFL